MEGKVIIIGGGLAGMSAATSLSEMGFKVTVLEKEPLMGGHVRAWDRLFPTRRKSDEVVSFFHDRIKNVETHYLANITGIRNHGGFTVTLDDNREIHGDAVLLATGYDLFDASKKEEYGHGI